MIINHITYSVSDITEAVLFYNILFRKSPIAYDETLACYDLDDLCLLFIIKKSIV